ncbi:hypothetical protein GUA87_04510 [Sneathiella sp. P13V-1]|uniref:thiamine phosphate synthase n=1 Tax=Sneathiella sp. P13V-1 TaxID=2697366 RepID=UPI00187B5BEF|nr:thiamine phosphate synthase [Sneathiella sp. P13V-1]MBE7636095.1 hypothetical protein [Sneathiella sp. P13V-1]
MQIPHFFYFTDHGRGRAPLEMAELLPQEVGIIFRHYEAPNRAQIAEEISEICQKRRLFLSIAGDPQLAAEVGAEGVHLPEFMIAKIPLMITKYPNLIISTACHSVSSLRQANQLGADFSFISPLFPTNSHPGARHLPVHAVARELGDLDIPVLGLGGITHNRWRQIQQMGFQGFGAIDLFEGA